MHCIFSVGTVKGTDRLGARKHLAVACGVGVNGVVRYVDLSIQTAVLNILVEFKVALHSFYYICSVILVEEDSLASQN